MTFARRLLLLTPAAVLAAAMLLPTGWESPVPLCIFKWLTGFDCSGCGMTRAFLFIGHGRLTDAATMHPASIPAFLIVAGMALTGIVRIVRGSYQRPAASRPGTWRRSRIEPGPGARPSGS